jgi:hypothetical protein
MILFQWLLYISGAQVFHPNRSRPCWVLSPRPHHTPVESYCGVSRFPILYSTILYSWHYQANRKQSPYGGIMVEIVVDCLVIWSIIRLCRGLYSWFQGGTSVLTVRTLGPISPLISTLILCKVSTAIPKPFLLCSKQCSFKYWNAWFWILITNSWHYCN